MRDRNPDCARRRRRTFCALRRLHAGSWLELAGKYYSSGQIAGLMADINTVDKDLIGDGTYYVIEHAGCLVASGGWTLRPQTAYQDRAGPPQSPPCPRVARIRAVFTAPDHARRGLAKRIMDHAERRAMIDGKAERFELTATLSGLPFYGRIGYLPERPISISLSNGETAEAVLMRKESQRLPLRERLDPAQPRLSGAACAQPPAQMVHWLR